VRIIAGALKGRRLESPAWAGLRPTSDRLRETLFNVLAPRIVGMRVLDGFAGTGAVGIEALSRGAAHVTFVERDRRAVALIERNLQRCGVRDRYAIIRDDLGTASARFSQAAFDLIFLDPPYDMDASEPMRAAGERLAPDGLLVVEHSKRRGPVMVSGLQHARELTAGDSALSFYGRAPAGGS